VHLPQRSITGEQLFMDLPTEVEQVLASCPRRKLVVEHVLVKVDVGNRNPFGTSQAKWREPRALAEPRQA
jgi:hypothetical protein